MRDTIENMKAKFITFFDGCYGFEPDPSLPNTFSMGVCKLDYDEDKNVLTVHLRRPGLLIGKAGRTLERASKHLECEIKIIEELLWKTK